MTQPAFTVQLTADAEADFLDIMAWSAEQFGAAAADRYEDLIAQALLDVAEDPVRPGARPRPELPGSLSSYHLASSRDRVLGERVKSPRHFLLFRIEDGQVSVVHILHDSRDLAQHLPTSDGDA